MAPDLLRMVSAVGLVVVLLCCVWFEEMRVMLSDGLGAAPANRGRSVRCCGCEGLCGWLDEEASDGRRATQSAAGDGCGSNGACTVVARLSLRVFQYLGRALGGAS